MKLKPIILGEVTQTYKDKCNTFSLVCECYLWSFRCVYLTGKSKRSKKLVKCSLQGRFSRERDSQGYKNRMNLYKGWKRNNVIERDVCKWSDCGVQK